MNKSYVVLPVLFLFVVLVSGCATTYDGSPPKVDQSRIDAVTNSATAWLTGAQGKDAFPTGTFSEPVAAFDANRTLNHWVLPVKDSNGKYIGFFITANDTFTTPLGSTNYPDPRQNLFSTTKDDAYKNMLGSSQYTVDQIKEPYLSVIEGKGYHWTSEVVINGNRVDRLVVAISIIDPSNADRKDISSYSVPSK
jgi:hypothetical protein